MEVGWHLRFSRARVVEVLVTKAGAAQIRHHLSPDMGWCLHVQPLPGTAKEYLVRLERE